MADRRLTALLTAITLASLLIPTMPVLSQEAGTKLIVEVSTLDCVADVSAQPAELKQASPMSWVANVTGGVIGLVITLKDLRSCSVSDVVLTTATGQKRPVWTVYAGKLYANIQTEPGENHVTIVFSYRQLKKVYAVIKPTNKECVMNITANAPVSYTGNEWVAGPWQEGSQSEVSATARQGCYIAGWMIGENRLTTNSFYSFTAKENVTLTLSAEKRGEQPPPPLIDFSSVEIRAVGPGKVAASTKPIEKPSGTPTWLSVLNPGTTLYIEAVPEGCGEFIGWRGPSKLEKVATPSLVLITEPGFTVIEAVFKEMSPCPYISIGPYRLIHINDLPLVAGIIAAGGSGIAVYSMTRSSRRRKETAKAIMSRWTDEMLATTSSWGKGVYQLIPQLVRENQPPENPLDHLLPLKMVKFGQMQDIMAELESCENLYDVLFTIRSYRTFRLEAAARQGYWAGQLLVSYLGFRGVAPLTQNILNEWVSRMKPVSSEEDAKANVELLWTDGTLLKMQEQTLKQIEDAVKAEGLTDVYENAPKPFAKTVKAIMAELREGLCPMCGQPVKKPDARYCNSCGSRLEAFEKEPPPAIKVQKTMTEHETAEAPEKPVEKPMKKPQTTGLVACPHCGDEIPRGRYCIKCGAVIPSSAQPAQQKTPDTETAEIKEVFKTRFQPQSRAGTEVVEKPAEPQKIIQPTAKKEEKGVEEAENTEHVQKPEPRQQAQQTISPQPPQPRPWKPSDWLKTRADDMAVSIEDLMQAVTAVAGIEDIRKAAYKAASLLADKMDIDDAEKGAFIVNMSNVLEYAVAEARAAQAEEETKPAGTATMVKAEAREAGSEQMTQPPATSSTTTPTTVPAGKISLTKLVREGPEPGNIYLLPEKHVKAAAVPSDVIAALLPDSVVKYSLETEGVDAVTVARLSAGSGPICLILTMGFSRSGISHRLLKPSASHTPLKRLVSLITEMDEGLISKTSVITHPDIYRLIPAEAAGKFKLVEITMDDDVAETGRRLARINDVLTPFAVAETLMPGVCEAITQGKLSQFLKTRIRDAWLAERFARALNPWSGGSDAPKAILLALGLGE
ncbi:MAG: zinc ribbon domain-containing protein [Candidatus Caldarchaeum sp.]